MIVAGFTSFALSGAKNIVSVYHTYGSPSASLEHAVQALEKVKSRLQALSPQRREQIEAACQRKSASGETVKSLKDLEAKLDDLFDLHCTLNNQYEEAPFTESHLPFTTFREQVGILSINAKALLKDIYKTTAPVFSVESNSPVGSASEPVIAWQLPVPPSPNLMATIAAELGSSPCADDIQMTFMKLAPVDSDALD